MDYKAPTDIKAMDKLSSVVLKKANRKHATYILVKMINMFQEGSA
jgi:hypothetical protein